MNIPVLLEPTSGGYRATTQCPVVVAAEGATEVAAMNALSEALRHSLPPCGTIRSLHLADVGEIEGIAERIRNNPQFSEFLDAIKEYRHAHNVVPEGD